MDHKIYQMSPKNRFSGAKILKTLKNNTQRFKMRKKRKRYFVEYTCIYSYVFRISYHRSIREMVIIARNNPCDFWARVVGIQASKN